MKRERKSLCIAIPNYMTTVVGGAELQSYYLAEELLLRGWKIEIVHFYNDKKVVNPQYLNPDIKFYSIKNSKLRFISFLRGLNVLFKTNSYYYYYRTDSPLGASVALFSHFRKIFSIYSCADNGSYLKRRYSRQFDWKAYKSKVKAITRYIDVSIIDKLIEFSKYKADLVIAQTNHQAELFEQNFEKQTVILRNSSIFNEVEPLEKENLILWVGNLRKIKRPELFIEFFHKCRFSGYNFVMIGEMAEKYDFRNTIEANLNKFQYIGKQSFEITEDWIRRARFIINTSDSEGFSNTFIQAWYHRTFILSLNSDPDDLFSRLGFGYFANGDIDLLVDRCTEYVSSYSKVIPKLDEAEVFVKHEFDLKKNVSKFEGFLVQ